MNSMRKAMAILIAMIMLASVFAGCAKEDSSSKTTVSSKNKEATTEKEETKQAETNGRASNLANAKDGDIVAYGNYEQDNNTANGKEEITWRVLALENGKALLVSEKILEAKPYNVESKAITWETCTLRTWLNNDFLTSAFSANEQTAIVMTEILNKDNPMFGTTDGGNDTNDKVFLLSLEEAEKYFADDADCIAQGTTFAKAKGLWSFVDSSDFGAYWWLRTPGYGSNSACIVDYYGGVDNYGNSVSSPIIGIRPAFWINL